ncbi:MAG: FG-GAP repeat protein, partial [Anaerolineales bacterium]|nr:FG-GAP repeat protein [Anaerolineales bacterium]
MSKRIWLSLFLLVVNFVIVLSLVAGMQPDGAVPAAISRDFETAVHNDIAAAEYVVSWQDNGQGAIPAGYQAPNRRQQFRTYFMDDGIMVTPRDAQDDAWTWGLRLIAAGDIEIGGETAVLTADQNQITYNRGRFSEWYHNSERGLEQGFTILSPLSDDPMLHIDLAVTGSLRPAMSEDGSAVHFVLPQGGTILRYSDLVAFDASGEMLSASMSVVELDDAQQAVRLSVDTVAAAYPITIDPLTSSDAQWRPFINQDGNFGFSVRDAGDVNGDGFDDVIVGANWFDGGQNNEGAAFLYYGSANGLSQVFGWKAESNIALAEMG